MYNQLGRFFFHPVDSKLLNMACVELKARRPRRGARYQMELKFPTDDAKASFLQRLSAARSFLALQGAPQLDQRELRELAVPGGRAK